MAEFQSVSGASSYQTWMSKYQTKIYLPYQILALCYGGGLWWYTTFVNPKVFLRWTACATVP